MRKPFIVTLGLLISFCSFAQEKIDVGLNGNLAIPVSDHGFGDKESPIYLPPGLGFGGSVEGNYWFSSNFSAGLELGYLMFADEASTANNQVINTNATAIPILAKFTIYIGQGLVKPYFELGAGYSIYTQAQSVELIAPDGPITMETTWDQSGAIVSPRLGLKVDFTDQISLKANVQYNQMFNTVDGDKSVDVSIDGETTTSTVPGLYANSVGYLGVNVGVTFTLFDYFGTF